MTIGKKAVHLGAALLLAVCIALPATTQAYDDSFALHGIETGKAFFYGNTNMMTPESLPMFLKGIIMTHDSLIAQGVTPDFIVAFSGLNVGWFTDTTSDTIKELIRQIDALGVRLEICSIAMNMAGVNPESLLPEFEIVGNSWISAIGYESKSKGYARITF